MPRHILRSAFDFAGVIELSEVAVVRLTAAQAISDALGGPGFPPALTG